VGGMETKQKTQDARRQDSSRMALLYASMPATFVLFWSTGFIGGKLGLQSAAPFTFLLYRFLIVVAVLLPIAIIWRAPWPSSRALLPIAVGGVLVHAEKAEREPGPLARVDSLAEKGRCEDSRQHRLKSGHERADPRFDA
jgi:hypothetical protein